MPTHVSTKHAMTETPNLSDLNDFFMAYAHARIPSADDSTPLSAEERDEFVALFGMDDLPANAMSGEMADGYLTACWIGPDLWPMHHMLAEIFGQSTLPICQDLVKQERLLALISRRYQDVQRALALRKEQITPDTTFWPLVASVDPADRVYPYQLDAQGQRVGHWSCKDWANGFACAVRSDDRWKLLVEDRECTALLAPLALCLEGFHPDRPSEQFDDEIRVQGWLTASVYSMHQYWKEHRAGAAATYAGKTVETFVRDMPKVGRNDPCSCGSGKKFKKCCGA